jgi:hypothetical protein
VRAREAVDVTRKCNEERSMYQNMWEIRESRGGGVVVCRGESERREE